MQLLLILHEFMSLIFVNTAVPEVFSSVWNRNPMYTNVTYIPYVKRLTDPETDQLLIRMQSSTITVLGAKGLLLSSPPSSQNAPSCKWSDLSDVIQGTGKMQNRSQMRSVYLEKN